MTKQKIAILGLGIEGTALCSFLKNHEDGINLTVFDKKSKEELLENSEPSLKEEIAAILSDRQVTKVLGHDYLDKLTGFDLVYRSPGINYNDSRLIKLKESGVKFSSQIKLFFDLCPAVIIGVTGTKGKGTTASLIYQMLKEEFDGASNKI